MEVVPGVYQIGVKWANVVLLVGEQITLIDTGWRGSTKKILDFLSQLGRSPSEVTQIVITHHHPDHAGSLAQLQKACAAKVAVHEADAPYVSGKRRQPMPIRSRALAFPLRPFRCLVSTEPAAVDILLRDGDELGSSAEFKVIHTPGHTPGSISLYSAQKRLLIVGDALNNRGRKLSLQSSLVCTDSAQARESVRRLSELDFDVLCTGHGLPLRGGAAEKVRSLVRRLST